MDHAVSFKKGAATLVGILSMPESLIKSTAMVVVVGGPQYRVGSHRQFVQVAQAVADAGYCCLRFDVEGMGDSSGESRLFTETSADIKAAVDYVLQQDGIEQVVLWGLCDGASSASMALLDIDQIAAVIAVNPWVHQPNIRKQAEQQYYSERMLQKSFWSALLSGKVNVFRSGKDFLLSLKGKLAKKTGLVVDGFVTRMYDALQGFDGNIYFALSGNDMTANEFRALVDANPQWQKLLRRPNIFVSNFHNANHTFSNVLDEQDLERKTVAWLDDIDGEMG